MINSKNPNIILSIVSYDPGVHLFAGLFGLYKYINPDNVISENNVENRYELVKILLSKINKKFDKIIYLDDRCDNLDNVITHFLDLKIIGIYVNNPRELYVTFKLLKL